MKNYSQNNTLQFGALGKEALYVSVICPEEKKILFTTILYAICKLIVEYISHLKPSTYLQYSTF